MVRECENADFPYANRSLAFFHIREVPFAQMAYFGVTTLDANATSDLQVVSLLKVPLGNSVNRTSAFFSGL